MLSNFKKILSIHCALAVILNAGNAYCVEFYAEKPDWLTTCKIYQPGFTKCATESVQGIMNHITNDGIPELKEKFGSMDPFKLGELTFNGNNNDALTITANLSDVVVAGFSKVIVTEKKVSKKDFSCITKYRLPTVRLDGKYKMKGKILSIPLNGTGSINIEMDDMDIIMYSKNHLYEKGGLTFFNVTDIKVELQIAKLHTHLENIFNGNSKEVEKSTNDFFNDNWRDFFEALRPLVTETIERILGMAVREYFNLFPASFLIGDIPTSEQLYGTKQ